MYVPVLLGTTRADNRSAPIAQLVAERLEAHGFETRVFEPLFGNLVQPEWAAPHTPEVAAFVAEMARADGFVLVFPEYDHGYPGALKNTLDHVYDEWNRKPFAFVSTGGVSGGLRAQENLIPVIRELQGVVVPTSVAVQLRGYDAEATTRRVDAMIADLAWWAKALADARVSPPPAATGQTPSLVTK